MNYQVKKGLALPTQRSHTVTIIQSFLGQVGQ
jgi:hypothetical protein